jgi:hypothetical protein
MATVAYPYETLPGRIDLNVSALEVDGESADPFIETEDRRIDVFKWKREKWEEAVVHVSAQHPTAALRDYIEPSPEDLILTAVAHCKDTNMRQTTRLDGPTVTDDHVRWTGEVSLLRSQYAGKIELTTVLSGPLGDAYDRYFGESQSWSVWPEEPPTHSVTGSIEILWHDFSNSDEEPDLTDYQDQTFYLDLGSRPILYLNSSFEGLLDLLEGEDAENVYEAAFRDSEYYGIAQSAWLAMFNAAASSIRKSNRDDRFDFPDSEWKRKVLKKILPKLMPEHSPSDALRRIKASMEGDVDPWVQSEVLSVIDDLIERSAALRSMFDRINRSS